MFGELRVRAFGDHRSLEYLFSKKKLFFFKGFNGVFDVEYSFIAIYLIESEVTPWSKVFAKGVGFNFLG